MTFFVNEDGAWLVHDDGRRERIEMGPVRADDVVTLRADSRGAEWTVGPTHKEKG
jgi:hypothetical protein